MVLFIFFFNAASLCSYLCVCMFLLKVQSVLVKNQKTGFTDTNNRGFKTKIAIRIVKCFPHFTILVQNHYLIILKEYYAILRAIKERYTFSINTHEIIKLWELHKFF